MSTCLVFVHDLYILIICTVFIGTAIASEHTTDNEWMTVSNELETKVIFRHVFTGTEGNHGNPRPIFLMCKLRFETGTFRLEIRCFVIYDITSKNGYACL
jgi:hypothetical protein